MMTAMAMDIESGGRRPASTYREARVKHIRVAYQHLIDGVPVRRLAMRRRCSPRTIHLWIAAALSYHDPEAEALRRELSDVEKFPT